RVPRCQPTQQLNLALVPCREVRMSGFGWHGYVPAVDVVQKSFTESRTGGDQRDVATLVGFTSLKRLHLRCVEHWNRVGHRLEIVYQFDAIESPPFEHDRTI